MADSVGLALLVVLETLSPAERLAFVLHDVFAVAFAEIADRRLHAAATRQFASRGRRRVQGPPTTPGVDSAREREVVEAYLAASRAGDFAALLAVLDPDVVLRADDGGGGCRRPADPGPGRRARWPGTTRSGGHRPAGARRRPGPNRGCPARPPPPRAGAWMIVDGVITEIDVIGDSDRLGPARARHRLTRRSVRVSGIDRCSRSS